MLRLTPSVSQRHINIFGIFLPKYSTLVNFHEIWNDKRSFLSRKMRIQAQVNSTLRWHTISKFRKRMAEIAIRVYLNDKMFFCVYLCPSVDEGEVT